MKAIAAGLLFLCSLLFSSFSVAQANQPAVTYGAQRILHSKVDEGHVPFPSVYHGLKWIFAQQAPAVKP